MAANHYSERFWDLWRVVAGGVNFMRTQLFGQNGSTLVGVAVDADGRLGVPDSYTLGYTGTDLTTITRASDGKVITLGYTGTDLTSVSDWT